MLMYEWKNLEDTEAGVSNGYQSRGEVEARYGEGEFCLSGKIYYLNFTLNMYFRSKYLGTDCGGDVFPKKSFRL